MGVNTSKLILIFARSIIYIHTLCVRAANTQASLGMYTVSPESSLAGAINIICSFALFVYSICMFNLLFIRCKVRFKPFHSDGLSQTY